MVFIGSTLKSTAFGRGWGRKQDRKKVKGLVVMLPDSLSQPCKHLWRSELSSMGPQNPTSISHCMWVILATMRPWVKWLSATEATPDGACSWWLFPPSSTNNSLNDDLGSTYPCPPQTFKLKRIQTDKVHFPLLIHIYMLKDKELLEVGLHYLSELMTYVMKFLLLYCDVSLLQGLVHFKKISFFFYFPEINVYICKAILMVCWDSVM